MRPMRIFLTVLTAGLLLWSLEAVAQQQPSPAPGFQGWGATPPGGYPPNYYQIPATSQSGWVTMQGPTAPPPGGYPGNYYQVPVNSQNGWDTMQGATAPAAPTPRFQGWDATPPGGYPGNYYQIPATSQSGWKTMQK